MDILQVSQIKVSELRRRVSMQHHRILVMDIDLILGAVIPMSQEGDYKLPMITIPVNVFSQDPREVFRIINHENNATRKILVKFGPQRRLALLDAKTARSMQKNG